METIFVCVCSIHVAWLELTVDVDTKICRLLTHVHSTKHHIEFRRCHRAQHDQNSNIGSI